jgi:hypothetical protein
LCGGVEISKSQRVCFVASVGIFGDVKVSSFGIVLGAVAKNVYERLRSENALVLGLTMKPLGSGRCPRGGSGLKDRSRRRRGEDGGGQLFRSVDLGSRAIR